MTVTEAIKNRRTVRGYLDKEVPMETIKEVLELARLSPSNCNTQPWHIAIVSGEARNKLEAEFLTLLENGVEANPDWPDYDQGFVAQYKDRQYDCAMRYYSSMGIEREDRPARKNLFLQNWKFFGAPHAGFLSMPKNMKEVNALDVGIFLQSLIMLFTERGIACCPQGALQSYPEPIRRIADVPDENGIMVGLSFGYEDKEAQINSSKMPRVGLEDIASFTS